MIEWHQKVIDTAWKCRMQWLAWKTGHANLIEMASPWMREESLFYPHLLPPSRGAFVTSSPPRIDLDLVSRIKRAYRLALEGFRGAGKSHWSSYENHARDVHEALLSDNNHKTAQILTNPLATKLFYGYYSVFQDLEIDETSHFGRWISSWTTKQTYGCLIRLAEATGAIPLWSPEGARSERPSPGDLESLLSALDRELGARIDFPNPFPNEFGLPTSRGIASYRAPQALYQASRLRELLRLTHGNKLLEIGGGMGRTAYYSIALGIHDYTIVDLPLANVAQACFLGATIGPDALWLIGDPLTSQNGRVRIVPPEWLTTTREKFDVVLNADSITEMDKEQAVQYFRDLRQLTPLLLSINQEAYAFRAKDLPALSGLDVHVERYPYWLRNGYVEEIFHFSPE